MFANPTKSKEPPDGYQRTRFKVPLRWLSILLIALIWDSSWHVWNLAQSPTRNIISGFLAVRYKREPIIPLYFVSFTGVPGSSLSSFVVVPIGVLIIFSSCISKYFNNSLMYFCSWIKFLLETDWFGDLRRRLILPSYSSEIHYSLIWKIRLQVRDQFYQIWCHQCKFLQWEDTNLVYKGRVCRLSSHVIIHVL